MTNLMHPVKYIL